MTYTGTHMYVDLSTRNSFKIVQEKNDVFSNLEAMFSSIKTKTRQPKQPNSQPATPKSKVCGNKCFHTWTEPNQQLPSCLTIFCFLAFGAIVRRSDWAQCDRCCCCFCCRSTSCSIQWFNYNPKLKNSNNRLSQRHKKWGMKLLCVCVFNFQFCVLGLYALLCLLLGPYGRV